MDEKFLIVKLNGGLGNQMFQWALARAIEKSRGIKALLDLSFFDKKYARPYELGLFELQPKFVEDFWTKIKLNIAWKFRKKLAGKSLLGLNFYSEPHFEYDKNIETIQPNTHVEGFFQSEKYFSDIEKELREDFQFKSAPDGENQELIEKIKSTNSISLHIRRGDYVQKKRYQNVYSNCSLDYYKKGVELIAEKFGNPTLFIFSDDIEWVKENLKLPYESVYVSHNTGAKSYEDLRLMSNCHHNVIANSSFSWWGAWLNSNEEKIVIAPQQWFNDKNIVQSDVIPENWIKLEN